MLDDEQGGPEPGADAEEQGAEGFGLTLGDPGGGFVEQSTSAASARRHASSAMRRVPVESSRMNEFGGAPESDEVDELVGLGQLLALPTSIRGKSEHRRS